MNEQTAWLWSGKDAHESDREIWEHFKQMMRKNLTDPLFIECPTSEDFDREHQALKGAGWITTGLFGSGV